MAHSAIAGHRHFKTDMESLYATLHFSLLKNKPGFIDALLTHLANANSESGFIFTESRKDHFFRDGNAGKNCSIASAIENKLS
jgi:hypothetical protein